MNKKTLFFAAAVIVQVLILAGVPVRKVYTRATGRDVILKVAPVDPYSILSGYYVTLGYDISQSSAFTEGSKLEADKIVYAIVEQQPDGVWTPVGLETSLPANLPNNRVALRGRFEGWRIVYGIEEFYIPEGKRQAIADDLSKNRNEARAEIKVDAGGNAALIRLRIQDRVY